MLQSVPEPTLAGNQRKRMEERSVVRQLYTHLDAGNYEELAGLLSPNFVHTRPDMVLEGRDDYLKFMEHERPETDTVHVIEGLYTTSFSENKRSESEYGRTHSEEGEHVVVEGKLEINDQIAFRFVDVVTLEEKTVTAIKTYTDRGPDSIESDLQT